MTTTHRWVQPRTVPGAMTHIHMVCPCGYTTSPVRPETKGALATIKAEYATHLADQATDSPNRVSPPSQSA